MSAPVLPTPSPEAPRLRSGGVTVIAVFSFLGSLFMLLMAVLMAAFTVFSDNIPHDSPLPPGFFRIVMVLSALFYLALAAWGITTCIGLFFLKAWARISIIVFAVLLALCSGFSALSFTIFGFAASRNLQLEASVPTGFWVGMIGVALAITGIGIWWIVYFTRASVKAQFVAPVLINSPVSPAGATPVPVTVPPVSPSQPTRPLSITVIAFLILAGCVFLPLNIVLRSPAMFFTTVLVGWPAALLYSVFFLAHLCIGIGLLRLKQFARELAIAYYIFAFVNLAVFYLFPGGKDRMADLMRKSLAIWGMVSWPNDPFSPFNSFRFLVVFGAICGLIGVAIPVYFLITRKQAYDAAAHARRNGRMELPLA
ncbi:MAG TPA: hypothetical protein VMI10_18760 [Terriglobales bacterium]|nr:hypothetical protein [Terriglobales bacterium]